MYPGCKGAKYGLACAISDIPTASAPIFRMYEYSAGVSRVGPVRPAYTPFTILIFNSLDSKISTYYIHTFFVPFQSNTFF